eukprot:9717556-Prorocentrum_lima.AAC.1
MGGRCGKVAALARPDKVPEPEHHSPELMLDSFVPERVAGNGPCRAASHGGTARPIACDAFRHEAVQH